MTLWDPVTQMSCVGFRSETIQPHILACHARIAEREAALAAVEAARQQAEADRKDAERYRWLREQHWSYNTFCVVQQPKSAVRIGQTCPFRGELDAAIDAAIAALPAAPSQE
jgi:hypothetical protein